MAVSTSLQTRPTGDVGKDEHEDASEEPGGVAAISLPLLVVVDNLTNLSNNGTIRNVRYVLGTSGRSRACWWRYEDDEPTEKSANAVVNSYGIDTNWYADTGATDHIVGELDKLTMK